MQQDLEQMTCVHTVSAIRCTLLFSDKDFPSPWLREYLRKEFPIERCQKKPIRKATLEGFRPTKAYFDAEESTFVWQDGRAVFIQTESPHNRDRFLRLIDAVVHACEATRPLNAEPLSLVCMSTHRFHFMPYEVDQFEPHRYFNIVPAPSAGIRKRGLYNFQNDINLTYGDYTGDYISLGLKFPAYGPGGSNGTVDLEITTLNPSVWWLDTTKDSVIKALDTMEELTLEASTEELNRILNRK